MSLRHQRFLLFKRTTLSGFQPQLHFLNYLNIFLTFKPIFRIYMRQAIDVNDVVGKRKRFVCRISHQKWNLNEIAQQHRANPPEKFNFRPNLSISIWAQWRFGSDEMFKTTKCASWSHQQHTQYIMPEKYFNRNFPFRNGML